MGISVMWDNDEQTVIRWDFTDTWDWPALEAAAAQSNAMTSRVAHRVDVIYHVIGSFMPIKPFSQFYDIIVNAPENTGIYVVTGGMFITAMITIFRTAYPNMQKNVRTASSLAEARQMIAQLHPTSV